MTKRLAKDFFVLTTSNGPELLSPVTRRRNDSNVMQQILFLWYRKLKAEAVVLCLIAKRTQPQASSLFRDSNECISHSPTHPQAHEVEKIYLNFPIYKAAFSSDSESKTVCEKSHTVASRLLHCKFTEGEPAYSLRSALKWKYFTFKVASVANFLRPANLGFLWNYWMVWCVGYVRWGKFLECLVESSEPSTLSKADRSVSED